MQISSVGAEASSKRLSSRRQRRPQRQLLESRPTARFISSLVRIIENDSGLRMATKELSASRLLRSARSRADPLGGYRLARRCACSTIAVCPYQRWTLPLLLSPAAQP